MNIKKNKKQESQKFDNPSKMRERNAKPWNMHLFLSIDSVDIHRRAMSNKSRENEK